ncbi:MAG: DUF3391 domain-containing protein, partial [Burkholderiales bacterium]|nr:DUF3391 domain-containing protein [Burkholderiales bacterium]
MLKKIPVRQTRLGMHLHKLEGNWIEHPFWKTRFVISDAADLAKLHASGVAECWIDLDLGLDVAPPGLRRRHPGPSKRLAVAAQAPGPPHRYRKRPRPLFELRIHRS